MRSRMRRLHDVDRVDLGEQRHVTVSFRLFQQLKCSMSSQARSTCQSIEACHVSCQSCRSSRSSRIPNPARHSTERLSDSSQYQLPRLPSIASMPSLLTSNCTLINPLGWSGRTYSCNFWRCSWNLPNLSTHKVTVAAGSPRRGNVNRGDQPA